MILATFSQWLKMYYFPLLIWYPFSIIDLYKLLCLKHSILRPRPFSTMSRKTRRNRFCWKVTDQVFVCYRIQRKYSYLKILKIWNYKINSQIKNEIFSWFELENLKHALASFTINLFPSTSKSSEIAWWDCSYCCQFPCIADK